MSEPSASPSTDTPQLGLWDCISIIVGIVIGTTIFQLPWLIFAFGNVPNAWMGLTVWVFGGFLALVGGLCYAELATTYPRSGGDYVYLTNAYGSWVGFLFGWAQLALILPASIGVMASVFADYATDLFRITTDEAISDFIYAMIAVLTLTVVNVVGVAAGKITQNVLSVAKVLGLILILVAGFVWGEYRPGDWQLPRAAADFGWQSLAIILVLYAYGGWNDAAFVAAEVRNRRRNIPLALILGIGAITVIYVAVNAAYLYGLGFAQAGRPGQKPLPVQLLEKGFGSSGGTAISIIVMISALGAVNGLMFTGARVYATLGADHRLFGWFGRWKPGSRPPVVALLLQSIITIAMMLVLTTKGGQDAINSALLQLKNTVPFELEVNTDWHARGAFETLVTHSAPAFWIFFILSGFSLFILREKNPHVQRPFSVPLYPLLPLIFCNMCAYMIYQSTIYIGWRVLFVVALLLLGLPLYGVSRLLGKPPVYTPEGHLAKAEI